MLLKTSFLFSVFSIFTRFSIMNTQLHKLKVKLVEIFVMFKILIYFCPNVLL